MMLILPEKVGYDTSIHILARGLSRRAVEMIFFSIIERIPASVQLKYCLLLTTFC